MAIGLGAINRNYIYNAIRRLCGDANETDIKKVAKLLHRAIMTPEGKISAPFLPYFARQVAALHLAGNDLTEQRLIAELEKNDLVSPALEPERIFRSLMEGKDMGLRLAALHVGTKTLNRRFLALQNLIHQLGLEPEANREIAARCVREALGFSGVIVLTVDRGTRTWKHCFSAGVQGVSRFMEPRLPEEGSEEAFLNKLLRGEVPVAEIERARAAGTFEWLINGDWGYLYIPDRSKKCVYFDQVQYLKDELGDKQQCRQGYGLGQAREKLYLVCGQAKDDKKEIFLINNWERGRPLFRNKQQDIELLRTFAASFVQAMDLSAAHQKLEDTSIHDELTGLNNRRYFRLKIESEFLRAKRYEHKLSLLTFDLDHFKKINDNYGGHPAGDYVLQELARLLDPFLQRDPRLQKGPRLLREKLDALARVGGEEFAAILPETPATEAALVAERIRKAVETHEFIYQGRTMPVTISIGVATYPDHALSIGDLIHASDEALYHAKNTRNAVVVVG